jgi:hypothetical protein
VVHIVDEEEEKRLARARQATQWDGFGDSVAWDDDDVRKGDYEPLPMVEGVKFVGIAGEKRRNLAFTQCVMTMSKFCFTAFAFREHAFTMCIHEELCEVGLVRSCFLDCRLMLTFLFIRLLTGVSTSPNSSNFYNLDNR